MIKNCKLKIKNSAKTFLAINFGCRVNAAESNQFAQTLIDKNFSPLPQGEIKRGFIPDIIFINTCAITQKGEYESLAKIRALSTKYPNSQLIVSGCANLKKITSLPNITIYSNQQKEKLLQSLNSSYNPSIKDKYSHTQRFILKIQSGCNQNCSYCIVPQKRPVLWSLPIDQAIDTVNQAIHKNYQEVIITGINLNLYQPGFSSLVESLLTKTTIQKISFGSVPLNCIDNKFINLIGNWKLRFGNFLHIPIQSGSDKILKLMHRPYTAKNIINTFNQLKKISLSSRGDAPALAGERGLAFGTDIIVGFPGETESDFQQTYDLCQKIGFSKIHVFRFSPRPNTPAKKLFDQFPKFPKGVITKRSQLLQKLISTFQTTPLPHQTPDN